MNRLHLAVPLILGALAPLSAQADFGARTHLQTATPPEFFLADGNLTTWAASVAGDPTKLIGGSLRSGHTSILSANGAVGILQIGRNPLIANQVGTSNYWGLSMEGEWIPLSLATTPNFTYSQDLFCLDDGATVNVFQWWKNSWVTEPVTSPNYSIVPGRAFLAVVDGNTRLLGFSKLVDTRATRLDLGAGPNWAVQHIVGTGESLTRRNCAMFEIGNSEIAVYSAYLDAWQRFTFPAPLTNYFFEYDKNTVAISDPLRNELFMYSAHTHTMQRIGVQDVASTTVEGQDFVVRIFDPLGNNLFAFRGIDASISALPGQAVATSNQLFGNNHYTVQVTDTVRNSVDYYGVSGSRRNVPFVSAGVTLGESVIADDFNDMTAVVVTDRALYGFSAFSNAWTRFANWQGTYSRINAQDFIGWVESDTHAYVFSPREDRWIERAKGANETLRDSDQLVVIGDSSGQSVYGMESTAFRDQAFAGPQFLAGRGNSYSYSIHDDPVTGASRIWFFQSYADRWIEHRTATRISDPNMVRALEDGLLVMESDRIHALSGFADVSTVYTAPNDNYAYHASPGSRQDFLASGVPNAAAVMLFGLDRAELPIAGVRGDLLIDPSALFGVAVGNYDARGILRLPLTVPTIPPRIIRIQMASFAPATGVQLGRLLQFEVF
jgi:hypothetical protein